VVFFAVVSGGGWSGDLDVWFSYAAERSSKFYVILQQFFSLFYFEFEFAVFVIFVNCSVYVYCLNFLVQFLYLSIFGGCLKEIIIRFYLLCAPL
jgi:hypothetical protein